MIRDLLRTIGGSCILAGAILYFTDGSNSVSNKDTQQLQDKVETLQSELAKTKKELAIAQTTSSTEKSADEVNNKAGSGTSPSDAVINTVVTIEPGSNSTVASATLERLGIIKDAAEFDAYLADEGLSGKIQIGEHHLDASMDFQTIAEKITTGK